MGAYLPKSRTALGARSVCLIVKLPRADSLIGLCLQRRGRSVTDKLTDLAQIEAARERHALLRRFVRSIRGRTLDETGRQFSCVAFMLGESDCDTASDLA